MRIIYCGTPQFAVPTLEKLIGAGFSIQLVVTNPDEPAGRGHQTKAPPVKQAAERAGLAVFQPHKLKDPETLAYLSSFRPEAIVVVAYGHLIPPWMIELPRFGCVNLHPSLLPKYRGAAPIPCAIIRGERITGITTMQIDEGLDSGPILLQRETEIRPDDTTETLSERLSVMGAELMVETLRGLENETVEARPQDAKAATPAPMLSKEDGRIDWSKKADEVSRRVRGLRPWPGAFTAFRGNHLHVWMAIATHDPAPAVPSPGTLLVDNGRLKVVCAERTTLEIKELQLAGRKRISARDFLNGFRLRPGEKLE